MNYCIYKITSPSGRIYIGQSKSIRKRITYYRNCKPSQLLIYRSIKKYGYDNHIFEILECDLTNIEADLKETELISHYKSLDISLNITDGGYVASDIRKRKVVQFTPEGEYICTYNSMTEAGDAIKTNSNSVISAIKRNGFCRGYLWMYEDDYLIGKEIVIPKKYVRQDVKSKIYQFSIDGKFIKAHQSIKDVVEYTGLSSTLIRNNLEGKSYDYKGFVFRYTKDNFIYKHPNAKIILQYDLQDNLIAEFSSLRDAQKILGISKTTILNKLKHQHKIKPQFPYIFKYKNND